MELINVIVDWSRIESLLMRNYPVGKRFEDNDAYPSLLLIKCLLLQQWFRIDSDPQLETKINDRISFKKFWDFLLTSLLPIIPLSSGSEEDFPKTRGGSKQKNWKRKDKAIKPA